MGHILLIAFIAAFVYSVILHEVAHGLVAKQCGDYTAEMAGRLTLNPIPHIDPMMTILMPIITYMFAGFFFGGAKPVPVNPYNFRGGEIDDLKVSVAGVATNLVIAFAFGYGTHLWQPETFGFILFGMIALVNLWLAFFNLIPIPPLDGSHVMRFILAKIDPGIAAAYERLGFFGFVIIIFAIRFLSRPLVYLVDVFWTRVFGIREPFFLVLDAFRDAV